MQKSPEKNPITPEVVEGGITHPDVRPFFDPDYQPIRPLRPDEQLSFLGVRGNAEASRGPTDADGNPVSIEDLRSAN